MPTHITNETRIDCVGTRPKVIRELVGRVNTGHTDISVARMSSPSGWEEPGQRPEFEEITVVIEGIVRVEHEHGVIDAQAGDVVIAHPGEWIRYSTPGEHGAEYVAICRDAFSPDTVHRDES